MTPPKVNNSTVTDTKDSEEEKKPNDLKNIRMINKMREDMYKKMKEFKEDTNS
jgi:hypothetical protein